MSIGNRKLTVIFHIDYPLYPEEASKRLKYNNPIYVVISTYFCIGNERGCVNVRMCEYGIST